MIFVLSEKKSNIIDFEITNFSLNLILKKGDKSFYLIKNEKPILEFNFISLVKGLTSNIVVSDEFNNIYIFDKENFQYKLEGYSLSEKSFSTREIIISKRISKGVYNKFIYNLSDKSIIEIINIPILVNENNFIFVNYEYKKISQIKYLLTGEYTWQTNLEQVLFNLEADSIEKIIGVFNELLWVSCTKALWGIDINTGKIIHEFSKPTQVLLQSGQLDFFRGYDGQIDEKNSKIIGFEHETYYELDLINFSLNYWIFTNECNQMQVHAPHRGQKCYTTSHIYFIDNLNGKIAVFNRENKAFDWIYTFPSESCTGLLNDIQITENKLYVLDTGGTLHIFEKEI